MQRLPMGEPVGNQDLKTGITVPSLSLCFWHVQGLVPAKTTT